MTKSIIVKTLLILGSLIITVFLGFGFIFAENDKALIKDIREDNLQSTMEALDERLSEKLAFNEKLMQESVLNIAVHSSEFLLNFDTEGLKRSLAFEMQVTGAKAVKIWDNELDEMFLFGVIEDGILVFKKSLPKELEQYKKIEHAIITQANNKKEELGLATFYYDESFIVKEIEKLKTNASEKIASFNATIDEQLEKSNRMKFFTFIGALIAILLIMSVLLMRFVNRPLKNLKQGLDSFFLFLQGKEESTQVIVINSNDEFGEMANSLNENIAVSAKLHKELNSLYSELEEKVQIRTQELAEINQEVQDSIEYASTIQKSFLKKPSIIEENFRDSFIIWQPRDKVGGDLYIYEESDEGIVFGVIDCTGHSVPGGFMTMLAGSILKKLSNEYFTNPAKLLSELNSAIKHQLNQDGENSLSDDGLDMGLCFINKQKNILKFAGAKIDLVYVKNRELHVIKSNKQSIGYKRSKENYEYTNHVIHLDKDESFYLYSDGISDQTGGEKNFPYGNKKFKRFLESIQDKSMSQQKVFILDNLANYQGSNHRRDDVTVIGFKI